MTVRSGPWVTVDEEVCFGQIDANTYTDLSKFPPEGVARVTGEYYPTVSASGYYMESQLFYFPGHIYDVPGTNFIDCSRIWMGARAPYNPDKLTGIPHHLWDEDYYQPFGAWQFITRFTCPNPEELTDPDFLGYISHSQSTSRGTKVGWELQHIQNQYLNSDKLEIRVHKTRLHVSLPSLRDLRRVLAFQVGLDQDSADYDIQWEFDIDCVYPHPTAVNVFIRNDTNSSPFAQGSGRVTANARWADLDDAVTHWVGVEQIGTDQIGDDWVTGPDAGSFSYDAAGGAGFPYTPNSSFVSVKVRDSYLGTRYLVPHASGRGTNPSLLVSLLIKADFTDQDLPDLVISDTRSAHYTVGDTYATLVYAPGTLKYRLFPKGTSPLQYKHIDYPLNPDL
jgi:hypothetical protein